MVGVEHPTSSSSSQLLVVVVGGGVGGWGAQGGGGGGHIYRPVFSYSSFAIRQFVIYNYNIIYII